MPDRLSPWERAAVAALFALCVALYAARIGEAYAQPSLSSDFSYFLPRLLDGRWWRDLNGPLAVPWFTPSFCGGIPRAADGQDLTWSVPELLTRFVDPLRAMELTGVVAPTVAAIGFALLLSRSFGASPWTSLLGAAVVLFNGAHLARTLAGHLAYHGMMMVPWACLAVTAPLPDERSARRRRLLGDVLLAGVSLAYIAWAGLLNLLVPMLLGVLAATLIRAALRGGHRDIALRTLLGGALAVALGLGKFVAFIAFFSRFRRDGYPLPGIPGVFETLTAGTRAVFSFPLSWEGATVANSRWVLEPHEWSYGVGPLPALGMLLGLGAMLRARRRPSWSRATALTVAALVAVLLVPLVVNVYTPGFNALLKRVPVVSSSSNVVRWWLAYVFVAPLGLLGFEALPARARRMVAMAGVLVCAAAFTRVDVARFARGVYPTAPVRHAWALSRDGLPPPPIAAVSSFGRGTLLRNTALLRGESPRSCYEPAFGYALERFPRGTLHPGPITDETDGALNLKNPACYLWPAENRCAPGDHFRTSQRDAMLRFAARRPFAFEMSTAQRVANVVTLLAWAFTLGAALSLALRARPREALPGASAAGTEGVVARLRRALRVER